MLNSNNLSIQCCLPILIYIFDCNSSNDSSMPPKLMLERKNTNDWVYFSLCLLSSVCKWGSHSAPIQNKKID